MRENLSPFANFVLTSFGLAIGAIGWVLWLGGCVLSAMFAVTMGLPLVGGSERFWWAFGIQLTGCLLLPALGSVMVFFARAMTEHKSHEVPTDLLPRWWFARFMRGMCLLWSFLFPVTATLNLVRLSIGTIVFLSAMVAAFRGYRYFRDKAVRLTPPYPPDGRPKPWRTRS